MMIVASLMMVGILGIRGAGKCIDDQKTKHAVMAGSGLLLMGTSVYAISCMALPSAIVVQLTVGSSQMFPLLIPGIFGKMLGSGDSLTYTFAKWGIILLSAGVATAGMASLIPAGVVLSGIAKAQLCALAVGFVVVYSLFGYISWGIGAGETE